jgi:hypothetical protein
VAARIGLSNWPRRLFYLGDYPPPAPGTSLQKVCKKIWKSRTNFGTNRLGTNEGDRKRVYDAPTAGVEALCIPPSLPLRADRDAISRESMAKDEAM